MKSVVTELLLIYFFEVNKHVKKKIEQKMIYSTAESHSLNGQGTLMTQQTNKPVRLDLKFRKVQVVDSPDSEKRS